MILEVGRLCLGNRMLGGVGGGRSEGPDGRHYQYVVAVVFWWESICAFWGEAKTYEALRSIGAEFHVLVCHLRFYRVDDMAERGEQYCSSWCGL